MEKVDVTTSSSFTPATAQEVAEARLIISVIESRKMLDFETEDYSLSELLLHYKEIDDANIKNPKFLADSKNILTRKDLEKQVEKTGKFVIDSPFGDLTCPHCTGGGERYKFFYKSVSVDCKFCTKGELIIPCKACKETGTYVNPKSSNPDGVPCIRCNKEDPKSGIDPETGETTILVGKRRVKCRSCRGSGRFEKFVIDSFIKSTTHCKPCRGKGFIPEKKRNKPIDNPVIPADLGKEIKKAVAQE
jgi:hypothetical protein